MLRLPPTLAHWCSALLLCRLLGMGWPSVTVSSAQDVVSSQVTSGQDVHGRECVRCHGPVGGQGETAPSLVSPEMAQKLTTFHTVSALFTFVRLAMPQDKPGTLPEADYWAVLAFILTQNGLLKEPIALGPDTAEGLRLQR